MENNSPPYPTAAETMAQHVLGAQLAPRSSSRSSSIASRYTPDGCASRPSAEMPRSEDYLTPYRHPSNNEMVLHQPSHHSSPHSRPQSSGSGYTPSAPEQYKAPQETGRTLPPAQLPLSSSPRMSSDGYDRPARPRYDSSASHRSGRSGRSSHSHGRGSHETKQQRRERQGREGRAVSVPRNHDLNEDYTLTRRETPRGYGSSLWSIFDGVKRMLRS